MHPETSGAASRCCLCLEFFRIILQHSVQAQQCCSFGSSSCCCCSNAYRWCCQRQGPMGQRVLQHHHQPRHLRRFMIVLLLLELLLLVLPLCLSAGSVSAREAHHKAPRCLQHFSFSLAFVGIAPFYIRRDSWVLRPSRAGCSSFLGCWCCCVDLIWGAQERQEHGVFVAESQLRQTGCQSRLALEDFVCQTEWQTAQLLLQQLHLRRNPTSLRADS